MFAYSGLGERNRGDLVNIWISLEVELLVGCFRITSEGVIEKDMPNNFIYILSGDLPYW